MLVIVASAADSETAALLPQFRRLEPVLLTPADLSRPGWRLITEEPEAGSFVASGRQFHVSAIDGVVTLLPAVFPQELLSLEASARTYAAHEMTAFLRYFLSSLRCPILNAATAGSLCGPLWRRERWLQVAASCGIATDVWQRRTDARDSLAGSVPDDELVTVTLIGEDALEDPDPDLHRSTAAIARAASVGMLTARYRKKAGGPVFCEANPCPSLAGTRAAHLVEEFLVPRGAFA